MKILFFGDVVGRPGREALKHAIPALREEHGVDVVIANVENLAHGFGITPETIQELRDAGVHLFTSGNHMWKNIRGVELLQKNPEDIVRPANADETLAGRGWTTFRVGETTILLINVQGQVFMKDEVFSPFTTFDRLYEEHGKDAMTIVDVHAEATGEKMAFGWYVAGKASLVVGTHTHVQTTDNRILDASTAYISDLGMSGAVDSSLGMDKSLVLKKVAYGQDISLEPPKEPAEVVASGVLVDIDDRTKKARSITRIDHRTTLNYTKHS